MLCLSRKKNESINVGDVVLTVLKIRENKVQIGIDAPKEMKITRAETDRARNQMSDTPTASELLRQLADRFRNNQEACQLVLDKAKGTEAGEHADQRMWCWKIAADYCESALNLLEVNRATTGSESDSQELAGR